MNNLKEIEKTELHESRRTYLTQSNEEIWNYVYTIVGGIHLSFVMVGSLLYELQERYASDRKESFQNIYKEKGFKKTQVQTYISKYLIFKEFKEENNLTGRDATGQSELIEVSNILEKSSQKTIADLKKLDHKNKERFLKGELSTNEVREMADQLRKEKTKKPKNTFTIYKSLNRFIETNEIKEEDVPKALDEITD